MSDTAVPETTDEPQGKAPEFEGEFDAEKAKALATNLRNEVASLKAANEALKGERDAFKEAAEKTGEDRDKALSAALKRAEDAERTLAIKEHNLPDDLVEEFADYLTGSPEEVKAKAAKLAARFKPAVEEPSSDDPEDDDEVEEPPAVPGRPKPDLVPGHGGEQDAPFDALAAAKAIRDRRY